MTLQRRDIYKLIEVAHAEGIAGDWKALWGRFRAVVDAIPRRATLAQLEAILADLSAIREEVDNILNCNDNDKNLNGNDGMSGPCRRELIASDCVCATGTLNNCDRGHCSVLQTRWKH